MVLWTSLYQLQCKILLLGFHSCMPKVVDKKLGLFYGTSPSELSVRSGSPGGVVSDYGETRPGSNHWGIKSKNLDLNSLPEILVDVHWSGFDSVSTNTSFPSELLIVLSGRYWPVCVPCPHPMS